MWIKVLGSNYFTEGYGLSADASGYLYVVGATNGPVGGGSYSGNTDYFIAKYSNSGSLIWTSIDGSYDLDANKTPIAGGQDVAYAVTPGLSGSTFVGGYVNANFHGILNAGAYGTQDAFISKFDSNGVRLWSKTFGSPGNDVIYGLTQGPSGTVYGVGIAAGSIAGVIGRGGDDILFVQLNSDGLVNFKTLLGTQGGDAGYGVASSSDGAVYVCGETGGMLNGQAYLGGQDAFLMKFSGSNNTSPVWTRTFGSSSRDAARAVTVAADGSIYVAGTTEAALVGTTSSGGNDAFITKFSSDGMQLWSRSIGSTASDEGFTIAAGADGNIYVGGNTPGNLNSQANNGGSSGTTDGFLVAYNASGSLLWSKLIGTSAAESVRGVMVQSNGTIYVSGATNGPLDGQPNLGFGAYLTSINNTLATAPLPEIPSYQITSSTVTVDEGKLVQFTLKTINVPAGTSIPYAITGVDATDISPSSLTGVFNIGTDGLGSVSVSIAADLLTEGPETLVFSVAGQTSSVIINDASVTPLKPPTYVLTSSSNSVNEGGSVTFTLSTTNVNASTIIPFNITGLVSASDIGSNQLSGTLTVNTNGQASTTIDIVADKTTEGQESLIFNVAGKSATVLINDTSLTPPQINNTVNTAANEKFFSDIGQQTATVPINFDQCKISKDPLTNDWSISSSQLGIDTYTGFSRIAFNDKTLAVDFSKGQPSYNASMVIGAAFGKAFISQYFSIGISLFDSQQKMANVCDLIVRSGIIESIIGNTNLAWVNQIYQNVVGVKPDGLSAFVYTNYLDSGTYSKATLLELATSVKALENQIDLIGLQSHGLAYTPFI